MSSNSVGVVASNLPVVDTDPRNTNNVSKPSIYLSHTYKPQNCSRAVAFRVACLAARVEVCSRRGRKRGAMDGCVGCCERNWGRGGEGVDGFAMGSFVSR